MTADRTPWWYSGGHAERPKADDAAADGEGRSGGLDWTALVAGAARMVDWATSAVLAPHSDHEDPRAHPDCVICRTVSVVGDPIGRGSGRPSARPDEDRESNGAEPVRWLAVVDEAD